MTSSAPLIVVTEKGKQIGDSALLVIETWMRNTNQLQSKRSIHRYHRKKAYIPPHQKIFFGRRVSLIYTLPPILEEDEEDLVGQECSTSRVNDRCNNAEPSGVLSPSYKSSQSFFSGLSQLAPEESHINATIETSSFRVSSPSLDSNSWDFGMEDFE